MNRAATEGFYLQDSRSYVGSNLQFWKEGGGYTTDIDKAELFSMDAAIKQNVARETDIPWPIEYLQDRSHHGVDFQHMKPHEAGAFITPECVFVYQVPNFWDGNDVFWLYENQDQGPLFDKASFGAPRAGLIMWPKAYIETKARRVVHQSNVSIRKALAGSGITLHKPKRRKPPTCKCEHCGKFISDGDRFVPCPHCGGDNSP